MMSHPIPAAADAVASFHAADADPLTSRIIYPLLSPIAGCAPEWDEVEDVMPIATGLEREEIAAELEGKKDAPKGPFGTKEAPVVIQSSFDTSGARVGCAGSEEDNHDWEWFWLAKGKSRECPVCSQYFVLEVVGPGGSPDGRDFVKVVLPSTKNNC